MQTDYRECPQCGEPIEGRANKKFCDETCKGRYFRENNSPSKSSHSLISQGYIKQPSLVRPETEDDESDLDWELREAKEWLKKEEANRIARESDRTADRMARAEQEQARKLHKQFCDLVQAFLESEGQILTARPVDRFLEQIDELTAEFRQHPYLKLQGNSVRNRLNELYGIHDILQEVGQEIAAKSSWQDKSSYFELTNKWRKLLRELLIAD